MARPSNAEAEEARRRERDPGGGRFVDLRLDFRFGDEILLSVGDRWDRRLRDFDGPAVTAVSIRIHPGQVRAVEWFRSWVSEHAVRRASPPPMLDVDQLDAFELDTDPAHVYSALFAGGRRGGKTWIAMAIAACYAVAFPGAIIWIVSQSDQKHDEARRYVAATLAADWLVSETLDGWELVNGSAIMLKSGYDPEGLKEGEANLVILNEGQTMKQRVYTVARGGIVDKSGLVLVCANPPVESGDEQWVSDFASDAAAGTRASVYLDFNPLENPHIDRRALLAMKSELDERSFAIEVLGQFRGPKDAVAYNWIRNENERATPGPESGLVDVTELFLRDIGEGEGVTSVVGLDVQRFPYIGGTVWRFYVPAGERANRDTVLAWGVDEVVLDGGDEIDFCTELREHEYTPETTLIVCDASGQYQHSRRRSTDSPPPEWRGRGSFDLIRGAGFRRIVPPSARMKKNPELVDRARAFTSLICSGTGRRRLFVDPVAAPKTCQAIREWKQKNGKPSRTQDVAHLGDGASYPIVRLFPRILRSGKPGGVDPVISAVDRPEAAARPTRVLPPLQAPSRGKRGRGIW